MAAKLSRPDFDAQCRLVGVVDKEEAWQAYAQARPDTEVQELLSFFVSPVDVTAKHRGTCGQSDSPAERSARGDAISDRCDGPLQCHPLTRPLDKQAHQDLIP